MRLVCLFFSDVGVKGVARFVPTLMCACSVLRFVGLGMCSTSSSEDCACVPSSMRPRRPMKLVRCVRMFLLHRIVVVFGMSTVGMWRMKPKVK
jgi:hypothetical protein